MTAGGARAGADPVRPSVWLRAERSGRGPTPVWTRQSLVAAAVALADAEGLGAVSMRAVATALGTGPGSLYRYVTSRDDLLDLMADAVVGELRPHPEPDAGDWLASVLAMGRAQLALHRRHPWLLELLPRPTGFGPESLAWFDAGLGVLEAVPAPTWARLEALALLNGVVTLVAGAERAPAVSPFAGLDLEAAPHLRAALARPGGPPPEPDLFERTVRTLLPGLLMGPTSTAHPPG